MSLRDVYTGDLRDAYGTLVLPFSEGWAEDLAMAAARIAARRVAWAVATWWREDFLPQCNCGCTRELPESLYNLLREEAPE